MQPTRTGNRTIHRRFRLLPLVLVLLASPSCSPGSDGPVLTEEQADAVEEACQTPGTDLRTAVEGENGFALDLYGRLRAGRPANLFFSPDSLSTAMAMTYAGAGGQTAEEIGRVLRAGLPRERLNAALGALLRYGKTRHGQGYRLRVANRLWGQQGHPFRPEFLAVTREAYGAEAAPLDFARQPDPARNQINAWIQERTEGEIRDLIPAGVLGAGTRLVLTSAIYFKGEWKEPFLRDATRPAPFHVSTQQRVEVPMMSGTHVFRYRAVDGLKLLELPYGKGDLAMVVLLPEEVEGLSTLEATLDADNLARWRSGMEKQEVQVFLPRFRLTAEFELSEVLKGMGMGRAFASGEADFSGMRGEPGLFLSTVLHKAMVDVNEEGTEAAAASAAGIAKSQKSLGGPALFRADHPFVFLIRDNRTGRILFLGRLADPRG